MNKTWLILDCDFLCHRAFHSQGDLSYKGRATGVIYGFITEILKLQTRFDTPHIIFCWDHGLNCRIELDERYKRHRVKHVTDMTEEEYKAQEDFNKQRQHLRTRYLPTIGFNNNFFQRGYEGDDVIAQVCRHLPKGDEAVIVASDKDLFQLLSGRVSMWSPIKGKMITLQSFYKEYDCTPKQWIRVKAIAGCVSDNVIGVQGVGEKTAIRYLNDDLKQTSKKYKDIRQFLYGDGQADYQLNKVLVTLPLEGTNQFPLKEDKISWPGYKKVCTYIGAKSLLKIKPKGLKR